jgi:hypothetical protein
MMENEQQGLTPEQIAALPDWAQRVAAVALDMQDIGPRDVIHLLLELAEARKCQWRPIEEMHEGHGPCNVIRLDDPGYIEVWSVLNVDWQESLDNVGWTHFAPVAKLTNKDAESLLDAARGEEPLMQHCENAKQYGAIVEANHRGQHMMNHECGLVGCIAARGAKKGEK